MVNITFAYRIMDLYDALHEMRKLSEKNAPFEFTYMSCDLTRAKSQGVIHVGHGRLLSRESKDKHKDADIVERYINLDTMETRHFYQPLLMTFNGIKVNLQ